MFDFCFLSLTLPTENHNKLFKKINNIMKKFSSFLIVFLLMLASFTAGIEYPRGDVNYDGQVTISDVTCLIDYLLTKSWPEEPVTPPDTHEYVDLGLPSGTLWATCNVGATAPEEYGDYFAWGETEPKEEYTWETYQWCNGSDTTLTKYCTDSDWGYIDFTDGKIELDPEDDAAYVNWGSSWRIPTKEQLQELDDYCSSVWTTMNSVKGRLFTGPNGNTLFLPAAGRRWNESLYDAGFDGYCWSRTLYSNCPYIADNLSFYSEDVGLHHNTRNYGLNVRAVRVTQN